MQTQDISNSDLVAGIFLHLNRAFLSGCTQSCAITGMLLARLAENSETSVALQTACENLRDTLEEWQHLNAQERLDIAPWVAR